MLKVVAQVKTMEIIDSFIFSDKIISALPGQFKIGYFKLHIGEVIHKEEESLKFYSLKIKDIYKIFGKFIFNEFRDVLFVDDFCGTETYWCESLELDGKKVLRITQQFGAKKSIVFTTIEAQETLYAMSHLFVATLGLQPVNAICFCELINHFSSFPSTEWEDTSKQLNELSVEQILRLLELIIEKSNLPSNAFSIYLCLTRFEYLFVTLVKMRIMKKLT